MANYVTSPNMNIVVPIPGLEVSPAWANELYTALVATIDSHDHTPGHGVPVTPQGMSITSPLAFLEQPAQRLGAAYFTPVAAQPAAGPTTNGLYVYTDPVSHVANLWYNSATGPVQITVGGSVAGSQGSITGLAAPAYVQYSTGTYSFYTTASNYLGNLNVGSVSIGPTGITNPPAVTLAATPTGSGYTLTFPAAVPAGTYPVSMSNTGQLSTNQYLPIAQGGTAVGSVTSAPTASAWAGWDANSNLSAHNFLSALQPGLVLTNGANQVLAAASDYIQYFAAGITGTNTQTVTLPVASTLAAGQSFYIINSDTNPTNTIALNSSGGTLLQTLAAGTEAIAICINPSGGTGAASWYIQYKVSAGAIIDTSTQGGVLYVGGAGVVSDLTPGTGGLYLQSSGLLSPPTWQQVALGAGYVSGTLAMYNGGTGSTPPGSTNNWGVAYYNSTSTILSYTLTGTTGTVLRGQTGSAPIYGQAVLTTDVTGLLPVGNGGTGVGTLATNGVLYGNSTGAVGVVSNALGASTQGVLVSAGIGGALAWTNTANININGTVGGGTANTGLFTTLTLYGASGAGSAGAGQVRGAAYTATVSAAAGSCSYLSGNYTQVGQVVTATANGAISMAIVGAGPTYYAAGTWTIPVANSGPFSSTTKVNGVMTCTPTNAVTLEVYAIVSTNGGTTVSWFVTASASPGACTYAMSYSYLTF